jgi:class 3 adenylate cyclase
MGGKSPRPTLVEKLERQRELEREQSDVIADLYAHYRNGTFLSVDIVNSTKLKEGQDSLKVVRTFQAFHRYLNRRTSGALASLFSGDGVMCLFERPQEAVDVAISILEGLRAFNREESSLSQYLSVRLGVHTGTLLLDNIRDLGRLTARDIDVAWHLQKRGRPGDLLISRPTWEEIGNKSDFKRRWRRLARTSVYRYRQRLYPVSEMPAWVRHRLPWQEWAPGRPRTQPARLTTQRIVWSLLVLIFAASCFLLYGRWRSGAALGSLNKFLSLTTDNRGNDVKNYLDSGPALLPVQERIPVVIGNVMTNTRENKYLTKAAIKQNDSVLPLPNKVFLVIPRNKNTLYNRKNGLHEETIYPLQKQKNGRYCVNNNGLFTVQVEILDDYRIFLTEKAAKNYLKAGEPADRQSDSPQG